MTKILSITYVPENNSISASVEFENEGKKLYTLAQFDLSKDILPTDFKLITDSEVFKNGVTDSINRKLNEQFETYLPVR